MFISQTTDAHPSTRNNESQKAPQTTDPQRSSAPSKGYATSPARIFAPSLHHDDPETPLDTSPREPENYRVHQSPERPVITSTQQTGIYAFHTAPIESYHSPSIDTRSDPVELGATSSIVHSSEPNPWQTTEAEDLGKPSAPALSRKGTDVSLSHFHVPGEFPVDTPGSTGK